MAQNDMLKRYLDAGMAFTQMTQTKAEKIVKDLVRAGEIRRDQTQERVDDLVERSRKNTEAMLDVVRTEIAAQLGVLGIATKADVARLEAKIAALSSSRAGAARKATAAKKAPAAKKASAAKKA
jgi:polyhydroxyalkanoate synthesis regulator phasin